MDRIKIIIVYHVFINHPENWRAIVMGQIDDLITSNFLPISYVYISLTGQQLINMVKNLIIAQLTRFTKMWNLL